MTLRRRAEEAAERVSMTLADCNPTGPYAQKKKIADAIEAEAKAFAERALRHVIYRAQSRPTGLWIAGAVIPKRNGLFGLG